MQDADNSNMNVKIRIRNELEFINTIVKKIKQELHEINDIVQTNGSLDTALQNAIDSLVLLAEETGVAVEKLPLGVVEEENPTINALSQITTGYITEKLQALSHE